MDEHSTGNSSSHSNKDKSVEPGGKLSSTDEIPLEETGLQRYIIFFTITIGLYFLVSRRSIL